jgi:hypothetical protein
MIVSYKYWDDAIQQGINRGSLQGEWRYYQSYAVLYFLTFLILRGTESWQGQHNHFFIIAEVKVKYQVYSIKYTGV